MGYALALTNTGKNDEWYTPIHAVKIIEPYVPKEKVIWCPFDKPESNFVKVFTTGGHRVICSHIEDGMDFFLWEPDEPYDCIISNPPYSKKDFIYQRLFELKKPFAMFVNINGLFDSANRFNLFSQHGIQILVPRGRTKFMTDYANPEKFKQPPFQTVYICWRLLPHTICFEGQVTVTDGSELF